MLRTQLLAAGWGFRMWGGVDSVSKGTRLRRRQIARACFSLVIMMPVKPEQDSGYLNGGCGYGLEVEVAVRSILRDIEIMSHGFKEHFVSTAAGSKHPVGGHIGAAQSSCSHDDQVRFPRSG